MKNGLLTMLVLTALSAFINGAPMARDDLSTEFSVQEADSGLSEHQDMERKNVYGHFSTTLTSTVLSGGSIPFSAGTIFQGVKLVSDTTVTPAETAILIQSSGKYCVTYSISVDGECPDRCLGCPSSCSGCSGLYSKCCETCTRCPSSCSTCLSNTCVLRCSTCPSTCLSCLECASSCQDCPSICLSCLDCASSCPNCAPKCSTCLSCLSDCVNCPLTCSNCNICLSTCSSECPENCQTCVSNECAYKCFDCSSDCSTCFSNECISNCSNCPSNCSNCLSSGCVSDCAGCDSSCSGFVSGSCSQCCYNCLDCPLQCYSTAVIPIALTVDGIQQGPTTDLTIDPTGGSITVKRIIDVQVSHNLCSCFPNGALIKVINAGTQSLTLSANGCQTASITVVKIANPIDHMDG